MGYQKSSTLEYLVSSELWVVLTIPKLNKRTCNIYIFRNNFQPDSQSAICWSDLKTLL